MNHPFQQTAFDLTRRAALITGAGVGIGRATAIALAQAGAVVGVHYHTSDEAARETLATIEQAGGRAILLGGDLTTEADANRVVDDFVAFAGRLDILFNNAGNPLQRSSIESCSFELWKQAFDVNVHSAFLVTRRAIPHLRATGHGSIINNLSLSVQTGGSGGAGPYAAAKGAMQVFTRTLSRELALTCEPTRSCRASLKRGITKSSRRPKRWRTTAVKRHSRGTHSRTRSRKRCCISRAMRRAS